MFPTAFRRSKTRLNSGEIFAEGFPDYIREMAVSLLPIIVFFVIFQIIFRRMQKRMLIRVAVGMVYTYAGLVLFLTGVNVGFMPAGNYLGQVLADNPYKWIIVAGRDAHRLFHRPRGAGQCLC